MPRKKTEPTPPPAPEIRRTPRQTFVIHPDKWEMLKQIAPQYGETATGLVTHMIDLLLEQHGYQPSAIVDRKIVAARLKALKEAS